MVNRTFIKNQITSQKTFDSLSFFPISNYMEGCSASCEIGEGQSTVTMTVWGGIKNQVSDGIDTYDVKLTNRKDKLVKGILKQQSADDITSLIDHLTRQHIAAKKRYHRRRAQGYLPHGRR